MPHSGQASLSEDVTNLCCLILDLGDLHLLSLGRSTTVLCKKVTLCSQELMGSTSAGESGYLDNIINLFCGGDLESRHALLQDNRILGFADAVWVLRTSGYCTTISETLTTGPCRQQQTAIVARVYN